MGAVMGGVLGLIVLGILGYFCARALWKRRRRRLAPSQQFYDKKWYYESGLSPLPTPRLDVQSQSWPAGDTSSRATPERQYASESEISVLPSSLRDHSSQPPRPPKAYHPGSLRSFMSRGRRSLRRSAPASDTTTAPYDPPVGEGKRFRVVNR
ncbi:hypothetical protein FIBSPDRAFT_867544 [Athelia psychrophila]|uniref:Uncharacterized protein n=1 Tax=Athelia psychrophila TaxID=1759441 RepID=A0A166E029_9AGAM|nr:hypothetical protein FIBSPDRAFT_867544 [Fibularhizoctonia sp. CBS 109695]